MNMLYLSVGMKVNPNLISVMRKSAFCICENRGADQLHGNSAFVLVTREVQVLLLCQTCWETQRQVFATRDATRFTEKNAFSNLGSFFQHSFVLFIRNSCKQPALS